MRSVHDSSAAPLGSVITACFNDGKYLPEAVAGYESYAPDYCELIIVNDGSTEARTLRVLRRLAKQGHRVLDMPHGGLSRARNAGIAAARGCYILPLDADNRLGAGYIEQAIAALETQPEIGVVYSDCREFGIVEQYRRAPEFVLEEMLRQPAIDACAVFRKQVWEDCGGYDERLSAWSDWELWLHAAAQGWRFQHLPAALFEYRRRDDSLGANISTDEVRATLELLTAKHAALYRNHRPDLLDETGRPAAEWLRQIQPPPRRYGRLRLALWRVRQKARRGIFKRN
jgi:glycosyltransferase involved in cell wall biosynthesis